MSRSSSALLLLFVALAACSSGPKAKLGKAVPTPSAEVDVARAAYVQQANAICTDVAARNRALGKPAVAAEYPAALRQTVANLDDQARRLRALTPPPGDAPALDANLIRLAEDQAARMAAAEPAVAKAAATGDLAQVHAVVDPVLNDYAEEAAQSVSFLRAYGLTECSAAG
jgi:hypothetical protein